MTDEIGSAARSWVISDGAAGNEAQAQALARALGLHPDVLRIRLRQPWDALAPHIVAGAAFAIRRDDGSALAPPWPAIAIGCGRRAALLTRALREWSGGRCFCVQILDPRIDTRAFDVVVAPAHDGIDGTNVIRSIGALNAVDAHWLGAGRTAFAELGALPSPRTAVLIGGSTRAQRIDAPYIDALLERLVARHASDGGSFMVSLSRRTSGDAAARLKATFATLPGVVWRGAADGDNPYAGYLGWADRIVVTPDSVNMLSEACATGKPVYTFAPRPIVGKLAAFHRELVASGHLRELGDSTQRTMPSPLQETAAIAELVRARWQAFVQHAAA